MDPAITQLVDRALDARQPLIEAGMTDALRLFHGQADGADGVVVERYGPALIVQIHEERAAFSESRIHAMASEFHGRLGTRGVYLKRFVRDRARSVPAAEALHRDRHPWIGEPVEEEYAISEHGLRYLVRPHDGFSTGLFLEHRDNRRHVGARARGRRVLNLFAYTCGFSVSCVAGGAASTSSVDQSRRYLAWGRRNFAVNGLDAGPHRFYASDTFDFFRRAARQGLRFDLVILDPPTFSRSRRPARVFELDRQLGALRAGALSLLAKDGLLFFATNHRKLPFKRVKEELASAAGERRIEYLSHPGLPRDFAGDPDYSKSLFASVR